MSCFIEKVSKFIYSKRKQILFALFALMCFLDKSDSINLLKSAAPAVVAAAAAAGGTAAASGSTTAGVTAAAAVGGAAASSSTTAGGTAAGAAAAGSTGSAGTGSTAGVGAASASNVTNTVATAPKANVAPSNVPNNVPRNANPNGYKHETLSSTTVNKNDVLGKSEHMYDDTSRAAQKKAGMSDVETEDKLNKNNRLNPELNKEKGEDDDEEVILDNASKEVTKDSGGAIIGCIFVSIFLLIFSVAIIVILLINPTTSVMSQIDCSIQESIYCVEEDSSSGFLNKLKNLFKYGSFASNTEIVIDKITEAYEEIKKEYDFIISIPLLSSSLFSDSEYAESDVKNGQVVITDKMLDRLEYVYDMAMLQLIPRYHIYTCTASVIDERYNIVEYHQSYQYTTDEENEVLDIPTGECDASTAGGPFKQITYYFDEEKYFKRLEPSEELDLVYSDYVDSDFLLVSKVRNQYYIYKSVNRISDVASYSEAPIYLEYDESVNLNTPLKGSYSITSQFGMRTGEYAGMHNGIDLVSSDKNIYAAGDGIVTRSNVETEGGNIIEITHVDSNGVEYVTQYAHLNSRNVSVGTVVKSGDVIGIMGSTGTMASGVHLHFSMWTKEPYELLNPRKLFSEASNY